MAKNTKLICLLTLLLAGFQSNLFAQLDLKKKDNLKDFESKTLYVVIDNNSLENLALQDAIKNNWVLSKYEFIDEQEYNAKKENPNDYFLVKTDGKFKKEREPGIEFLTLFKGENTDIVSLPMQSASESDGKIVSYLGAYVNIIQDYIQRVQKNKISAHIGLAWYSNRLKEIKSKNVLINEDDIAEILEGEELNSLLVPQVQIVDEGEIDKALAEKSPQALVSLSVAPVNPLVGSYCYKMLISTNTNELYYFKKQKITTKNPSGFTKEDIKAIVYPFN